jgi:putative DNA primase/helicase
MSAAKEDKLATTIQGETDHWPGDLNPLLEDLTPEWLAEIAIPGDTVAMARVARWLDGKAESPFGEVQQLLPRLPSLFFERHRAKIAKKLGVRVSSLDQLRHPSRVNDESDGQGTAVTFDEPEPWLEPVNGGVLLDDLAALFRKYIVLPDGADAALALWTIFAWLHDRFQVSPLLVITSPQKRCGKTTLLALLGQLVPRPLPVANVTAAALFRIIESYSPTVLADEADTYFRDNEVLRGILDAGHMRSLAYTIRGTEPKNKTRKFTVWGPKAIALIGRLKRAWSTVADRSIVVQLQRKKPNERVERMRLDRLPGETEELRRKLVRWTADIGPAFPELEPPELLFLNDRAADNWRPLLAIALAASEAFMTDTWLERAQQAARMLSAREEDDDVRVFLLEDLRALYAERSGLAWVHRDRRSSKQSGRPILG